ncbi:MAG TPA: LLM class flavin-dependent oxidoreductase [Terriglobales bacterium]|nr:LLM class flavin-dependent oxidoreductase [Terriglobales bacterium]
MSTAAFLNPGADLAAGVDLARRADALGYHSVWVTHGLGRDSFLVLAAYGAATTRAKLGVGVLPIYPRHPVTTAQAALTLAEQTGGRYILGLGVSHKASMEQQLGLKLEAPHGVTREYVAVLRGAFGDGARFEGAHYRVQWSMAVPGRLPAPPIYLAALSTKMLELAGEIADGVVLWLCDPAYVRTTAVPALERGRRRAGKTLAGFEIVAAVPLAVTDELARARDVFRAELARYFALPFYRAMLEASGHGAALKAVDGGTPAPDTLLDALGAIGDAARCRAYVQAYRDAGVTLPAIRPISFPDAPWYRRTVEDMAGA